MKTATLVLLFTFGIVFLGKAQDEIVKVYDAKLVDSLYSQRTREIIIKEILTNVTFPVIHWTNECKSPRKLIYYFEVLINETGNIIETTTVKRKFNFKNKAGDKIVEEDALNEIFSSLEKEIIEIISTISNLDPLEVNKKQVICKVFVPVVLRL